MTPEEKRLLLTDLCARLPYGVKVQRLYYWSGKVKENNGTLELNDLDDFINQSDYTIKKLGYEYTKPYLRPLSSMTKEERIEFESLGWRVDELDDNTPWVHNSYKVFDGIDWLNKKMFDYRGLIEKGLALEAPEEMYKTE